MRSVIALGLAAALGITGSIAVGSAGVEAATVADSHAVWCAQNYRSYNPRTDTYTGFDGHAHVCVSPFVAGSATFATVSPLAPDTSARAKNPNGPGSGTAFRLHSNDNEGGNNGTTSGY